MGDEASSPRCVAPAVACRRGVAAERDIDGASAWSSSAVSGGAAQWGRGGVKHGERDEVRIGYAIYRARKGKGEARRAEGSTAGHEGSKGDGYKSRKEERRGTTPLSLDGEERGREKGGVQPRGKGSRRVALGHSGRRRGGGRWKRS
ncbi:uncharacterized protein LOC120681063 [Panicum virgatum]|uniref:uncharacterized protein LOC120681063 n=1 Tax=Panicum virgatum TaxID=38727 RepID=UPI0019D5B8F5|nr:uncharacterized protein LOC120681063 [Panicum virgatum]